MAAPPAVSDLNAHLGFWLRAVSNHVSHAFAAKLARADVTVAEWVLLRTLYGKPPTPPSHLADEMGMTRGAITKLADRLIAKALVLRKADPDDGRAQTLSLTARSTNLVPKLATMADENDTDFFKCLSATEQKTLRQLLKKLLQHHNITTMPVE